MRPCATPGGKVLISWQPWFHPYGHHGQGYIPVPWVHVLLNDRQRTEVCARIVDLPEFKASWWDLDADGNRINRFRAALAVGTADSGGFLNKLTMGRFERLCGEIGLAIEQRTLTHFQGPVAVQKTSWLMSRIPGLREFFTANAAYVLSLK